jgi:nanoRNase/pAp phosphatase (c-di-AMP/oligoRNAs hydrolase)
VSLENQSKVEQLVALHEWLNDACSRGAVPVLTGKNGDMDTIGSAIALSSINSSMMAGGLHLGRVAKKVVTKLQAPFRKMSAQNPAWPVSLGGIVVVDAASPGQVGIVLPEGVPLCILDHHATTDWQLNEGDINLQWNVRATTQIVSDYLHKFHPSALSTPVRKMLLAGLITDTGRFKHADLGAFQTSVDLLSDQAIDYAAFLQFVETEITTPSERGSLIRGLSRCNSIEAGPWNLVHTNSGTLEGRLASLILGTGAEVSLVSRFRDGETRLTARAPRTSTALGVHLGNIMQKVAEQIGGEGGGHDGAAGWSGKSDLVRAQSAFISHLTQTKRKED